MPLEAPRLSVTENATSFHLQPKASHDEQLCVIHCFLHRASLILSQLRDTAEGADIIMVKPALPYLDIIADAAELAPDHPLACYQVSGEFAMIHAGAAAGVYELRTMAFESVESMVRAGATLILTYFTPDFLDWLS